jgi:hypothetical protein
MEEQLTVMSESIQWGFAGFAFLLLSILSGVLVWLSKSLLRELRDSNAQKTVFAEIVSGNTAAISALTKTGDGTLGLLIEVKDLLLSKPCMFEERERAEREKNGEKKAEHRPLPHGTAGAF